MQEKNVVLSSWDMLQANVVSYKACSSNYNFAQVQAEEISGSAFVVPENILQNKKLFNLLSAINPYIQSEMIGLFVNIINDMAKYNFNEVASVNNKIKNVIPGATKNDLELLTEINLTDHSINVVNVCIRICVAKKLPSKVFLINLVICLTHDFGKCKKVVDEFTEGRVASHEHGSAHYTKKTIKKFLLTSPEAKIVFTSSSINSIFDTLFQHHKNSASVDNSLFRDILIEADTTTRELELENLKNSKKPNPSTKEIL